MYIHTYTCTHNTFKFLDFLMIASRSPAHASAIMKQFIIVLRPYDHLPAINPEIMFEFKEHYFQNATQLEISNKQR